MSVRDTPLIAGIDFSSAPSRRKPIVVARLRCRPALDLEGFDRLDSLAAFDQWLAAHPDWVAGCDFPFGLPRPFVDAQGWRGDWLEVTARIAALSRPELIARCRAWCAARPVGDRFAHRRTDRPAGSSPSMKWVNPPVALMLHAGAPRLAAAGVDVPGLRPGDLRRVALEAYPGLFAREVLGRLSYKSDDRRRDDDRRRAARAALVAAVERGSTRLGLPVRIDAATRRLLVADHSADALDAVICAVQAAWAWERRAANYGIPLDVDPCEGWIVTAIEAAMVADPGHRPGHRAGRSAAAVGETGIGTIAPEPTARPGLMYLPEHFAETRPAQLERLVREHPLGILVTCQAGLLDANHLPFEFDPTVEPHGVLACHVARANPVWRELSPEAAVLVVFRGVDGYISPNWYPSKHEQHRQVPTWNYEVVHAHGVATVRDDEKFVRGLVARLTRVHEASEPKPWRMGDAAPGYIDTMVKSIVGIEIRVERLVGKAKLSQNKDPRDRRNAADELAKREQVALAAAMRDAG